MLFLGASCWLWRFVEAVMEAFCNCTGGVVTWRDVEVGARCRSGAECYVCRNVFFFFMKWVHSKTLKFLI